MDRFAETIFAKLRVAVALPLLAAGCANMDTYRADYPEPNDRLDHVLALYKLNLEDGKECHDILRPRSETGDCARLLSELDRLVMEFPSHGRILLANAVLSYEAGRKEVAQAMLDRLLAQGGSQPEAAILRARIALEQGNVSGAVHLLERQTMLAPGNLELRSALASAYYASGDYARARNLLLTAGMDAHEPWEHAYHLGLLAEAEEDWQGACEHYRQALRHRADFVPARARIIGLTRYAPCAAP